MKPGRILPILLLIFSSSGFSQEISFFAEDLKFSLNQDRFEVDGLYYFRNNTSKEIKRMLFYPFPETAVYGPITHISIRKEGDTTSMLTRQTNEGCLFKLKIPPHGEVVYRIGYGQEMQGNEAKYIITTTQAWDAPFEMAKYQLVFPKSLKTLKSTLPPDSIATGVENVFYFWKRQNFMPNKDFEFEISND